MLRHAAALGAATGVAVPLVQAGAERLPFADASLRPGLLGVRRGAVRGRAGAGDARGGAGAAARRALGVRGEPPDALDVLRRPRPGRADRQPVRTSTARPTSRSTPPGAATYVEHHRTLGDRVRDIVAAGLVLDDLVEPEWPDGPRDGLGPVVPAARRACSRARRSSSATAPDRDRSRPDRSQQGVQPAPRPPPPAAADPHPAAVPHLRLAHVDPDQRAGGRRGQLGLPAHRRHRRYPRPARAPPTRRGTAGSTRRARPVGARSGPAGTTRRRTSGCSAGPGHRSRGRSAAAVAARMVVSSTRTVTPSAGQLLTPQPRRHCRWWIEPWHSVTPPRRTRPAGTARPRSR